MKSSTSRKSPRNASPVNSSHQQASFPLPAYLDFVPGGVDYGQKESNRSVKASYMLNYVSPDSLVKKALAADETLHKYAIRYQAHANAMENKTTTDPSNDFPRRLPSLSVLAEAAFAPLTGVHATSVRKWADAMVLAYVRDASESVESIFAKTDDDLIAEFEFMMDSIPAPSPTKNPQSPRQNNDVLVNTLKSLHQDYIRRSSGDIFGSTAAVCLPVRPCGYVFRRGDIAWNCRTCQSDSTCVLCDTCFHNSDHEGHEVYFHRTSPGGCCDCGDTEAWRIEGCCPMHRPKKTTPPPRKNGNTADVDMGSEEQNNTTPVSGLDSDSLEAFKACLRGRSDGEKYVKEMLPPKVSAALGVVIGAAVQTIVEAIDGASIGADLVQWTRRWADQMRRIYDGCAVDEEYAFSSKRWSANSVGEAMKLLFPNRFRLQLRLHNDDVHTYDEVIDALHTRNRGYRPRPEEKVDAEVDTSHGLVQDTQEATDLTQHVDQDGQVVVRAYTTFEGAIAGFDRLKERGLHCAVVSTPQSELEARARVLLTWLSDISSAHPAVSALVVHALVDVTEGTDMFGKTLVWGKSKMIPAWSFSEGYLSSARVSINEEEEEQISIPGWRRRMNVFPPHLASSYLSREETLQLHKLGFTAPNDLSSPSKGVDLDFYSRVPYTLQSERYRKSPHSLWGVMPSPFAAPKKYTHPVLYRDSSVAGTSHHLVDRLIVLDTDLRKQQEADMLTTHPFTHQLVGLHMISGVGLVDIEGDKNGGSAMKPTAEDWRQLLSISSYRAPTSPLLIMLLLDPYPTKQLRGSIHQLFLSLLTDSRLRTRFAASLGGIGYRSLTTLFCAGVGTEADTPLNFTVQIFTAGSIVRALCSLEGTQRLLSGDDNNERDEKSDKRDVFCLPLAHNIARCIHTNLLGACKEVQMVLKNTAAGKKNNDGGIFDHQSRNKLLPALVYQQGEQPLSTLLPTAPDDGFLDCRSTKHKRLPHLLRDLEYVLETPGTAMRLLRPDHSEDLINVMDFSTVWCRLLRLAQGMDPQKRKISGGHVEFEQLRWLEAFSLSLHFAGARDKLAESLPNSAPSGDPPTLHTTREAMGNLFSALLREMKWWLYKEGILETGLPKTKQETDTDTMEALQRSTLHVSTSSLGVASIPIEEGGKTPALSCATQTKMTESHLEIIESAIRIEQSQHRLSGSGRGTIMGDWLRVPHSPHAGDCLSFHLPLHRSMARNIRAMCSYEVSEKVRESQPSWWQLPVLDNDSLMQNDVASDTLDHPLCALLRPTLRSSNCRITWSAGPECNSEEAQRRRSRSRAISSAIASAKVVHSLCDHPLRCLAAAEQISRHLWARNGSSAAGMALNYGTTPLCRSFRDLDITMVQLSASGFSIGLGARRVFSLILSRFDLEGYLCDLEKRGNRSPTNSSKSSTEWVIPRRLQDPEHAQVLMEGFFSTLCILVTELPPPPPLSSRDNIGLTKVVRRELLHVLAASPLSYSKAMDAASVATIRKDDGSSTTHGDASSFRTIFGTILKGISQQKNQGSRAPTYELKSDVSDEYDPSFFHLKRSDHQQAMDNIARLRKQKCSENSRKRTGRCLPLVTSPPLAHPRFMPCRMILHLPILDASIRRALMFALFGGKWLPPTDSNDDETVLSNPSFSSELSASESQMMRSAARRKARSERSEQPPFSEKTVNNSSVSFLEVLQLLTLQVHTLEECAYMHRSHPNLDIENKSLSASLSINTYLGRLVHVPSTLVDVWAFRCYPEGPLRSGGSGLNKASILGLLIALFEHRSDHGIISRSDSGHGDDDHGGARYLVADGLKWLLRFVSALVHGAESVSQACKSASDGIPILKSADVNNSTGISTSWSIDDHLQSTVIHMLDNLPDLWPSNETISDRKGQGTTGEKNREARKAAQMRIMEKMKRQQASFAASMAKDEKSGYGNASSVDNEADLCIICRCDDEDGENNGPLGYLGHVQRSRTLQLRCQKECQGHKDNVLTAYRVVGDKGCQIRKSESLDSAPVACIPLGSILEAVDPEVQSKYDLQSRRIFVRHISPHDGKKVEGWASIQSATSGYVILSPLSDICYRNTRWGATRPFIHQCGHAAHLKCVERHVASIHQKSQTDTPYDGRFAADIEDGEFLCPLCKQLCNVVVPAEGLRPSSTKKQIPITKSIGNSVVQLSTNLDSLGESLMEFPNAVKSSSEEKRAIKQYGNYLEHSMQVFSWNSRLSRKRKPQKDWHDALRNWDFKEEEDDTYFSTPENKAKEETLISDILRLLRQQHVAWAAAGHTAASAESSCRGIKKDRFEPPTTDPWDGFNSMSKDTHSMLLELRRTLTAASSLQTILCGEMNEKLEKNSSPMKSSVIGYLLGNILKGESWVNLCTEGAESDEWNILTALLSSLPCHLAKDETLTVRHEARSIAAQIWVVKGMSSLKKGSSESNVPSANVVLPPPPLCVRQARDDLKESWGSMHPSQAIKDALQVFRPALANGVLYMPLLSWDLTTFAAAIFSSLLSTEKTKYEDLSNAASIMLVARMIQVLVTLNACENLNDCDGHSFEDVIDTSKEGPALVKLYDHCKTVISNDSKPYPSDEVSRMKLLAFVSRSVLPFGRAMVLALRASMSVLRQRNEESKGPIDDFLESEDTMYIEDGLYFMKELRCPLPSEISWNFTQMNHSSLTWPLLITRWVKSLVSLDACHGSRGDHLVYDHAKEEWTPALTKRGSSRIHDADKNNQGLGVNRSELSMKMSTDNMNDYSDQSMYDDDESDDSQDNDVSMQFRAFNGIDGVLDINDEESDDEEMEDVDGEGDFDDIFGLPSLTSQQSQATLNDASDESDSSLYSWDRMEEPSVADKMFANVSTSAIIPYQPSVLGFKEPGPGPRGCLGGRFDYRAASTIMRDESHLGLVHYPVSDKQSAGLIRLPRSFVELYSHINKVKGIGRSDATDDQDDGGSGETAICLVTGAIIRAGTSRRVYRSRNRAPGACTLHARKIGSGTGVFFLLQKCTVLLVHNKKSSYSASIYVDENGEEDPGLSRGRPLFLKEERYEALAELWRKHGIPGEVAQIRSTSDRVIRDNWY